MKTRHSFDRVFDTQSVFRKLLDAIANPGRVGSIADEAQGIDFPDAPMLAIAATLLDNETTCSAIGGDLEILRDFTGARISDIPGADYLFVCDQLDQQEIASLLTQVRCGTMEGPDTSCTLIICLPEAQETVTLKGPGIPGTRTSPLGDYGRTWLRARAEAGYLYPCGVDFFFLTEDGKLFAAPRLCTPQED